MDLDFNLSLIKLEKDLVFSFDLIYDRDDPNQKFRG